MKFNISVEIDWLEDNSIDDEIKQRIVEGVVERISEQTIRSIKEDAEKRVVARIEELVGKTYEDFLGQGVTITDRWGEVIKENVRVIDLIKERCDKWLVEKVNSEGRSDVSYDKNWTRMEWLVNKQLKEQTKRMADEIVQKVNAEIKTYINESLKSSIGEKLVKEIGLENIINSTKGKS